MKTYGSETLSPKQLADLAEPDVADIHAYGLSGGGKDYHKGRRGLKAAARRRLKKAARRDAKKETTWGEDNESC